MSSDQPSLYEQYLTWLGSGFGGRGLIGDQSYWSPLIPIIRNDARYLGRFVAPMTTRYGRPAEIGETLGWFVFAPELPRLLAYLSGPFLDAAQTLSSFRRVNDGRTKDAVVQGRQDFDREMSLLVDSYLRKDDVPPTNTLGDAMKRAFFPEEEERIREAFADFFEWADRGTTP